MAHSDYVLALTEEEKTAYFKKLKQLGFVKEEDDPFVEKEPTSKGHLENWSTSIDSWPTVEFGDIYVYLIDCPGYTPKSLKAYKSLEAYSAFANGWVHQLNIRQSNTGHCIIRASVNKTQNISDGRHNAWVGFKNEDGSIISGHCTCMNSSATICIHAVAIMFQVEAAPRLLDTGKICTVCHCTKEEVLEPQTSGSSSAEEASVIEECKSDVAQPQEEFQFNISTLPEASDSTGKFEPNYGEVDSKDVTYIECEGVEPGTIIILSTEGHDDQDVINTHLNEVHSCQVCNLNFATQLDLENHMETHNLQVDVKFTENAEMVSNIAQQEISTESDKTKEAVPAKTTRARKGKFQCSVCKLTFTTSLRLENHKKKQHKEENPESRKESEGTPVIETESTQKEEPAEGSDNNTHSFQMPQAASLASLLHENDLKIEQLKDESTEQSDKKRTGNLHDAENLFEKEANSKAQPATCTESGKRLASFDSSMHTHLKKLRQGIRPFKCAQCGVGFSHRAHVQRHMLTHTKEKPFECKDCDRKFACQTYLEKHKGTVHKKDKSYICESCGKNFTQRNDYIEIVHLILKQFLL